MLDILERGSVPVAEYAEYCNYVKDSGLGLISYYLSAALLAISRDNSEADIFIQGNNGIHSKKLRDVIVPTLKEKYGV